jgi:hypothetical protein
MLSFCKYYAILRMDLNYKGELINNNDPYKKRRLVKYILRNSSVEINSFLQVAEKIVFHEKFLLSW